MMHYDHYYTPIHSTIRGIGGEEGDGMGVLAALEERLQALLGVGSEVAAGGMLTSVR
jgi:hypothetical protein